MNILDKLERKIGKYAIKNLMLYLTVMYAAGFFIYMMSPEVYVQYLALDVSQIVNHLQIWRLVTWLMYPPSTSAIFGIIMIYLYYVLGKTLENTMGAFKFDAFIITGILLHIIAAFIAYYAAGYVILMTPNSLNMTIFLAYVFAFPDSVFLLFFIIPVKGKFLGIIYLILTIFDFVTGGVGTRIQTGISILNFAIFFFGMGYARNIKNINFRRQQSFREAVKKRSEEAEKMKPQSAVHHKCTICGKTDADDPEMEFRFCSKCGGNYEYCMEHLFNHTHKNYGEDN